MAWYDTLGTVISKLATTDPAGAKSMMDYISGSNEMVATVNQLLAQVQRNPESAQSVATEIITMKGLDSRVKDLAQNLPNAAKDPSGQALIFLVSQIQSALPRSRWF